MNTLGSYSCTCIDGYLLSDAHECVGRFISSIILMANFGTISTRSPMNDHSLGRLTIFGYIISWNV